ncbi:MAG: hypothetical protein CSA72_09555 [Rhodobacterales bacterium]|nr:MAG: hypothetical protein CSA72_09555 [Rhodobacterales bacterium]
MRSGTSCINSFVAAIVLAVGYSLPVAAQDTLDTLFSDLATANPETAEYVAGRIRTRFAQSGSPTLDLLLERGRDALEAGDALTAAGHLTALTDHAPDFAEGFATRASAFFALGLYGPALDDLRRTLILEPRHFDALQGVAVILEETGDPKQARAAWQQVQAIHPQSSEAAEALARLALQLDGEDA